MSKWYACTLQLVNTCSTLQFVCTVNKTKLKNSIVSMLKRFPLNDQTLWIQPQTSKVKIPLLHDLRFDTRRGRLNKTKTTLLSLLKWTYELRLLSVLIKNNLTVNFWFMHFT